MSVVGPCGSGKTKLIFYKLSSKTFRLSFNKSFPSYKECQPLFDERAEKLNVEFAPFLDFSKIKKQNLFHQSKQSRTFDLNTTQSFCSNDQAIHRKVITLGGS